VIRSKLRNSENIKRGKIGFISFASGERTEKIGKSFAFYPFADGTYIDPSCERITNRRLLDKNVIWEWAKPWEILAKNKLKIGTICERSSLENFGGDYESIMMRRILNEVRTYFQEKSKDFS
jgi:hypothetical protein